MGDWLCSSQSFDYKMGPMTALLADPVYRNHRPGPQHPERPERFDAVLEGLRHAGIAEGMPAIKPRAATEEEIALCHRPEYIRRAKHDIASGAGSLSTGDTDVSGDTWNVALQAVGGVINAVDAVMGGKASNAFCVVRPPGHHATPSRGMGFCVFNNIAAGARHAQKRHGAGKVLIADWDVHHGNGTQDIFYRDSSVFFFSTHQFPWYPGTGRADETGDGEGKGTTLNCPFPAGSGRTEIVGAFRDTLVPAAAAFKPDLVMISAGFDSREGDPLGRFRLTDSDFSELTGIMIEIADRYAHGRVVSVLEGGYNLSGLASAAVAHVRGLTGATGKSA